MQARQAERYWAIPGTVVEFVQDFKADDANQWSSKVKFSQIWDMSKRDCGLKTERYPSLDKGATGRLLFSFGIQGKIVDVDDAKVERTWTNGVAFSFPESNNVRDFFGSPKREGISEAKEANRKKELALADIDKIGFYIRQIKDCQLKIFIACFTLSIGIASILAIMTPLNIPFQFKTLIAICPAWISIVCAILSLQKGVTINRSESFLTHLKQQLDQGSFFPFYRGWEDALANYYSCIRMRCKINPRCIKQASIDCEKVSKWSIFRSQSILFSPLILSSYVFIYLFSLMISLAILFSKPENMEWGFVFTSACIATGVSMVLAILAGLAAYHAHCGRFSLIYFYYVWERILNKCPPFHPDRLISM